MAVKKDKLSGLSVVGFLNKKGIERNPVKTLEIFAESCRCAYERVRYGFCFRDTWNFDRWFMAVMRGMLTYYRDNRHGSPLMPGYSHSSSEEDLEKMHKEWTETLGHMIFLLGEMDKDTCSRKNKYEGEYERCGREFSRKYGKRGEKLSSPEEEEGDRKKHVFRLHTMQEVPEYKDIFDAYLAEEREIEAYREKCKDEFFQWFSRYFFALWD